MEANSIRLLASRDSHHKVGDNKDRRDKLVGAVVSMNAYVMVKVSLTSPCENNERCVLIVCLRSLR